MSEDEYAKRAGFLEGYRRPSHLPPPNPYPLRTEDRRKWSDGWVAGRRLRQRHNEELEQAVLQLIPGHTTA